jgi:colicin import membrane protein
MNEIVERDLIALPLPQDALAVFTTEGAIEPYLARVREAIDAFKGDVTTADGRKAIKSMAHRVAKAKTALEAEGKRLADEQKEIPKKIDATRKHIKDTLDAWRDEVRKPVDEYEAAEEARVEAIKANLAELQGTIDDPVTRTAEVFRDRLKEIEADEYTEARFGEYVGAALELKATAVERLTARIADAEKREAEQAELEALRKEKAERDRLDREADIRASAEREATARAEAAAKAEREAAEARERQLVAEREAAERRAVEAAEKAQREIEAKAAAERAEAEKREANKKHRAKINNEALAALIAAGIAEDVARSVVTLIASKAVPHVSIAY